MCLFNEIANFLAQHKHIEKRAHFKGFFPHEAKVHTAIMGKKWAFSVLYYFDCNQLAL